MSTGILEPPNVEMPPADEPIMPSYLRHPSGVLSWLLTKDHKRIAILYLITLICTFFLGGAAITLVRLNLMTPNGTMLTADTYNRLFTMHGVIMVFFFLVPVVPTVLGNFCLPLMIGAKDVAFPRINLLSWYLFTFGAFWTLFAMFAMDETTKTAVGWISILVLNVVGGGTIVYFIQRWNRLETAKSWLDTIAYFLLLGIVATIVSFVPAVGKFAAVILYLVGLKNITGLHILSTFILSFSMGVFFFCLAFVISRLLDVDLKYLGD